MLEIDICTVCNKINSRPKQGLFCMCLSQEREVSSFVDQSIKDLGRRECDPS